MKKCIFIMTTFATILLTSNAKASATSGSCGATDADCHWEYANGVLTISGTGNMLDYPQTYGNNNAPWWGWGSATQNIVIENGMKSVGAGAFYGFKNVHSIDIPNSVNSLGDGSFWNSGLTGELVIPSSVTTVGYAAFYNVRGVTSITIPTSVSTIENSAFGYMTGVTSLTIPSNITEIGGYAFQDMTSLTSLTIPDTVTKIDAYAFKNAHLSSLEISSENLQRYLSASGGFADTGDLNVVCTTGDCKAVLEAWDADKGTNYASRVVISAPQSTNNSSTTGTQTSGGNGGEIGIQNSIFTAERGKRIYTVKEANEVAGKKNKLMIRYK